MLGQKTKSAKPVFNAGILRTFGKLSQHDIDVIDGHAERLVTQLVEQYDWNLGDAQSRVEGFRAGLSNESKYSEISPNARVGS
jgi:uncharacterized protein (DUF2132 family)